jgi:maleamate amidohydrolase
MNPLEGLRLAMAETERFYKERGIFQDRFGFGEKPALIVIDMAYGWTDPAYGGGSARLDSAIAAQQKLLPAARAKKIPIIFTTSPYEQYAQKRMFKSAADDSDRFRKWDRRAFEIDERVKPEPHEYIIYKEHSSAFAGTPLIGFLAGQRIDTLLITGCSTSACVRSTATDAKSNYLKPIVIREAVEDRAELAHEWTLFDIQSRFADVISLEEAMSYLGQIKS